MLLTKPRSFSLTCLLACLVLFSPTLALESRLTLQTPKKETSTEEEQKRRQELERKTLTLLDEIASAASGLKLPENKTFVLISVGRLMWKHDEKRARNIFWEAINALNLMKAAKTSSPEQAKIAYFEVFGRRREILQVVAERDPQFALELLQASRQVAPEMATSDWFVVSEQDLEHQIASVAIERDPKRALQLARESLAKGLSLELVNLLFQINQKDSELGTKFAGEIAAKIQSADIATDRYAPFIATQLLIASRPVEENSDRAVLTSNNTGPELQKRLTLPAEERRALVEQLVNGALSVSATQMLAGVVSEVMPEVEEFFPERVMLLKRKMAEKQRGTNQGQLGGNYNYVSLDGRPPEEILKDAVKRNDEERRWLEREAVLRALVSNKAESLREFVTDQMEDDSQRKRLLDFMDGQEIEFAATQNDPDALRKLLPKIRLKELRARAMAELAILLETKGDHDGALTLLDEAQSLIKMDLQSETKSNAMLSLMLAYALIEPARAFAMVEKTIDRANDDISKVLLLDKFVKTGVAKKGEVVLQQAQLMPMDYLVLKYGKGVAALARADFGRTKAAADRFERYELRLFARLLIAQALLGEKPNAIIVELN